MRIIKRLEQIGERLQTVRVLLLPGTYSRISAAPWEGRQRANSNGGLPLRLQGRRGSVHSVGWHPAEARQSTPEASRLQASCLHPRPRFWLPAQGQVLDRWQDRGGARGTRGRPRSRRRPVPWGVQVGSLDLFIPWFHDQNVWLVLSDTLGLDMARPFVVLGCRTLADRS